mmetsp:Transcript_49699/g.131405  ORF Transcript_49699/g.131405 Transcript_49699/m.131405 type:complete len:302 (-) Transcript_49699:132-1037(-)
MTDDHGSAWGTADRTPLTAHELVEQGLPTQETSRPPVPTSLQALREVCFERWGRVWLCAIVLLVLGMFYVLIWSQWIYDGHHRDHCDQPLAPMLKLLYIIVGIYAFQSEIIRHLLCYSAVRDGPVEPCRITLFRRACFTAAAIWPVAGGYMLTQAKACSTDLRMAVRVIMIYYAVVAVVAVIVPASFVAVVFCLIRHGVVRMPRSRNAAPDDLVERLPKIPFDPSLFDDSGDPGRYPAACPICLDDFQNGQSITNTPCVPPNGHVFHTDCLQGWLQCARSCPLCRMDLTEMNPEAGIELTA